MLANSERTCFTVKDIPAGDFIKAYAEYLKKNDKVQMPDVNTLYSTHDTFPLNYNSIPPPNLLS